MSVRRRSILGTGFRRQLTLLTLAFLGVQIGVTVWTFLLTRRVETGYLQAEAERLGRITTLAGMQLDERTLDELASIIAQPELPDVRRYAMIDSVLASAFRETLAEYPGTVLGFETAYDRELYVYGPDRLFPRSMASQVHRLVLANKPALDRVIDEDRAVAAPLPGGFGDAVLDARPVKRDGEVIGAVWGMRFTSGISTEGFRARRNVGLVFILTTVVALVVVVRMSRNLIAGVESLEKGLQTLEADLGFRFAPMNGEFGRVAIAINRMADTLQRMRGYEEEARRNERLAELGRLVAGVAHEIRNPLTAIQGYVEYWAQRGSSPPSRASLDVVLAETRRLAGLMERLLDFARPATITRESADLEALVTQTMAFVAPECAAARIEVKRDVSGTPRPIEADGEQIRQVLLNLLGNAIQAMPGGGVLMVSTSYSGGGVDIRVSDTGCGISPEHARQVFTPFFTTKPDGVGLGLAISLEIVRAHGGWMDFSSEEGKGTTFRVMLPYTHGGEGNDAGLKAVAAGQSVDSR